MRKAFAFAIAAALTACGSNTDFSQNCSMNVSVNGGAQQTVSCFAAGAAMQGGGSAVSITIPSAVGTLQAAQFGIVLSSTTPAVRTYAPADVSSSIGQVQTTGGALYVQSSPSLGTFSLTLTNVTSAAANGQTAYFIHGSATVTLAGQGGAPGTATLNATF